ncbi:MAG TPA: Rieske 2Fe-2S domain-containing protein [Gemmatimonadaceae bacterium]|nr:Rieske 2Fe-2S domain-containing protein [Gemmatimonadaceae bacterium]
MTRGAEDAYERAARASDVPLDGSLGVTTSSGRRICLLNVDGEVLAVSNDCTHQAFPLSEGVVLPGARLECAWHGAQFDCRTGEVLRGPAVEPLERYAVRVEGDDVLVGPALP